MCVKKEKNFVFYGRSQYRNTELTARGSLLLGQDFG